MKILTFVFIFLSLLANPSAFAKSSNTKNSLQSLGSNKAIAERAKAIDAKNRIRVVQNRSVDRNLRFELGATYGGVAGGDSYIKTNQMGYMLDFHINPMVSIGARYYDSFNELTNEGQRVFTAARERQLAGDTSTLRPGVDFPLTSTLGVVTLYPLYGKLNFFNQGVTQFDLYVLGGYGQMKLQSGSTETWTAGGGMGIWWSKHFSSRLEARYQSYQDKIYTGTRDQAATTFSIGIGILL